jgi:hypothetical protein
MSSMTLMRFIDVFWIPVVVAASLVLAAPAAWLIAPRLRAHYGRRGAGRAPLSAN